MHEVRLSSSKTELSQLTIKNYSDLKLFTGFVIAARKARYPTVIQAMETDATMVMMKIPAPIEMRKVKFSSQPCMK